MSERKTRIIQWEGDGPLPRVPEVNYASYMLREFSQYRNDTALVDAKTGKFYTYGDVIRSTRAICNGLAAGGVRPGDAVLMTASNHIDMPPTMLAIMLLGATCVPVNPLSTKAELKHMIGVCDARWAVSSKQAARKVEEVFRDLNPGALRQIWIIGGTIPTRPSIADLMKATAPETAVVNEAFNPSTTVALLPFSSGTTGLPKGVMLTHKNLVAVKIQHKFVEEQGQLPPFNVYESLLIVSPLYHMTGFNGTMVPLFKGGKVILLDRFSPKDYLEAIERYKVVFTIAVPYILRFLVTSPLTKNYDLSSLLMFGTGTEPVSESTLEKVTEKTGKITLQGYGMTETSGGGSLSSPEDLKANCIGKFGPFFQAKVVDLETGEMLGEGQVGELCLRGPLLMMGYAKNPKATSETIDSEGWLHTGDIVHYNDEDFFYITGRIKDLIKVKGFQVAPAELEGIISKMEGVAEVAVVGVPHGRLGEAPRAWVVPTRGVTIDPEAIIKHVADQVSPYKQLAGGVELAKILPKNHLGKIVRKQLRKSFEATKSKL